MSGGEDEDVITGDEDYKEEEEAITTTMDASGIASLDDARAVLPASPTAILDSTITVDTQTTTKQRQPSPSS